MMVFHRETDDELVTTMGAVDDGVYGHPERFTNLVVDKATFQTQKVQFLFDTILGLINLEQSHIIKLFSVLAVIFMPPTMIASIYGMNFKYMPELEWLWGYPFSLVLMVVSSALLYVYFRLNRWL